MIYKDIKIKSDYEEGKFINLYKEIINNKNYVASYILNKKQIVMHLLIKF